MKKVSIIISSCLVLMMCSLLTPTVAQADMLTDTAESSSCVKLTSYMAQGSTDSATGGQVTILRNFLTQKGYSVTDSAGTFGSTMVTAVKAFQASYNTGFTLAQTGIVSAPTRLAVYNQTCGMTSPTASLTVGFTASSTTSNSINVNPGDSVTYRWSSSNADQFSSTYTGSPSTCGSGSWSATNASSSVVATIPTTASGCTLTIQYTAKNSLTNQASSSSITVRVSGAVQAAAMTTLLSTPNQGAIAYISSTQAAGMVPLYRMYSPVSKGYYLTTNYSAAMGAKASGWVGLTTVGYIYSTQVNGTVPLYAYTANNKYFFTKNKNPGSGYRAAGIIGYVK